MKKFVFSLLVICLSASASFGQKNNDLASSMTEKMTTLYNLSTEQIPEMQKIQERKYRNLSEIEVFKNTDEEKYILKLRAVGTGHDASVRRMLNEEQREIFDQKRVENRQMVAVEYKKMREGKVSKEAMNDKIIELELVKLDNH